MDLIDLPPEPMLCSGHAACPGCVDALSVRHVLAMLGPDTMAVIPPSCMRAWPSSPGRNPTAR